jgi:hypothetical protein
MGITIVEVGIFVGVVIVVVFLVKFLRVCCSKGDPLAETIPIINNGSSINEDSQYTDI